MPGSTAQEMPAPNRRVEPRLRTLKAGKIVFNNHFSVFDCVVRNMTKHGACIEVANTLDVPAVFDLIFADGSKHFCNLRWRYNNRIGVEFAS
ncbi:MAG TPA: PilZ domain-containing protein [Xanthobacteraceae bacterium]|jgi:hypothetical protein